MPRALASAVAAGLALFVWGFLSHAVLGWQDGAWNRFADEAAVAEVLGAHAPIRGVYHLPYGEEEIRPDRLRAFVNVVPPGESAGMGRQVVAGLLIQILSALVVVGLWSRTRERTFRATVGFFAGAGLAIGFASHAFYWNWFGFPADYVAVTILDTMIGWTLAGAAVAAIVSRGRTEPA